MKRNFITFFSILSLLFVIQYINGSIVRTKGTWGNDRIRTITPAAPEVSIMGNTLQVYFQDALSNLTVSVTTSNGIPVYSDCISSEGVNYTYEIPLELEQGDYVVTLIHVYGQLTGDFTVE